MPKIEYVHGNLFDFVNNAKQDNHVMIPHVTNDIGAWGSGFVIPLGNLYPEARNMYLDEHEVIGVVLGTNQFVTFDDNVTIVNMCAQRGIMSKSTGDRKEVSNRPVRYWALSNCLQAIEKECVALNYDVEIHAPAFGSDRAGGNWEFISTLIEEILVTPTKIYVYYLNEDQKGKLGI